MRTDVKALPLEGWLPRSAQPVKQTGDRPRGDQEPLAQVERKRSEGQLLNCAVDTEGQGGSWHGRHQTRTL